VCDHGGIRAKRRGATLKKGEVNWGGYPERNHLLAEKRIAEKVQEASLCTRED